jgi:hypothetical protein
LVTCDEGQGRTDEQLVRLLGLADHRQVVIGGQQIAATAPQHGGPAVQVEPRRRIPPAELELHQLAEQVVEPHRTRRRVDDGQEHPTSQELANRCRGIRTDELTAHVRVEPLEHAEAEGGVALGLAHGFEHLDDQVLGQETVGSGIAERGRSRLDAGRA